MPRNNASTDERRKQALDRLQPVLSRYNGCVSAIPADHARRILALPYRAVLSLCVKLAAHQGATLPDHGPLTIAVLQQVAVVLTNDVGLTDANVMLSNVESGALPKATRMTRRAKRKAQQTATATPATPTPTPVAAAVQQTLTATPTATPVPTPIVVIPGVTGALTPAMAAYPGDNWQLASQVFGVAGIKGYVSVFDGSHPETPKVDPDYVWDTNLLQSLVASVNEDTPTHTWVVGERGSGKTTGCEQFAARLGRPFCKITFEKYTEKSDFVGQTGMQNANTVWEDGALTAALRWTVPPIIMFDEISYARTDAISGPINETVHPACCYRIAKTNERITFDRRTLFLAADNTNGSGDSTGRYHGTQAVNRATVDRFGRMVTLNRMATAEEIRLIGSRASCDKATATKVVSLMDKLRGKCQDGALADPPSIREGIAFAKDLRAAFLTPAAAFEQTFVTKYPPESHEELRGIFTSVWK